MIVALPTATPVTNPVPLTLAIVESEEDQKAVVVSVFVEPSLKVPVAAICKVLPCWIVGVAGPTVRVERVGFTKKPVQPLPTTTIRNATSPQPT